MAGVEGSRDEAGLVLVYVPAASLSCELTAEIEKQAPGVEVQLVRDVGAFCARLDVARADVLVADVTFLDADGLISLLGALAARAPAIVVDGRETRERRRAAQATGAVYVESAGLSVRALAQVVVSAYRAAVRAPRVQETRRHLLDILEASSDGIFVTVDGVFYFVNDALARALGSSAAQLVGQRALLDFVPAEERAKVAEELGRIEVGSGSGDLLELGLERQGGPRARFEVAFRTSVVDNQRALVGIARDVTAARELEQDMERARQRMAQVERLRALGELAAGVAHDFNNAIGTILGRVLLARQKLERGESTADDLGVIELAAKNAAEIVQRIREYTRPTGTDTWQEIDLGAVVAESAALVKTQVPEGVTLEVECAGMPRVQGNPSELREVVLNLLRNSLEAVGAGGHVTVRALAEGGRAVLEVEDDGAGMSSDVQQRLFEPFFTTKDTGTGLGLSVSRWILRRHDAQLDVRSAPGEGTTFRASFTPPEPPRRPSQPPRERGLTILVVDDDASVADMIHDLLTERGYNVLVVHSPAEAAQLLGKVTVDLMITDLDLPGMSGWQLARNVRDVQPGILIGLITGWPLGASDREIRARGVDFVLTKPFTPDALSEAVLATRRGASTAS